jgi:hypothetical protein
MATKEGNITRRIIGEDPTTLAPAEAAIRDAARQGYLAGLEQARSDMSLGAPQGHNEVFDPYVGLRALARRIAGVKART